MYGAYHHITVAGKENCTHDHMYDVTGSLCESIDRFAVDRLLPEIEIGDLVVIHDTGAHGHSMGSTTTTSFGLPNYCFAETARSSKSGERRGLRIISLHWT